MNHNSKLAVCIILIIWLSPVTAKTYRWVDERGMTIYSQTPPPSGKATIIKPPPKPAADPGEIMESLKRRQAVIDDAKNKNKVSAEEKEALAKNAEIKKKNCKVSKDNLEGIQQNRRVRIRMEDGSLKSLSDEERQAKIDQYTKDIEKWCK